MSAIAYCAGVIDGEGYVSMYRAVRRYRTHPQAMIAVEMTDFDTVIFLSNTFGCGSLCQPKVRAAHHKPSLRWTVGARNALQVANLILPYSISKREGVLAIIAHYKCNQLQIATA